MPTINSLFLYDLIKKQPISQLKDGDTIYLDQLPKSWSLIANASGTTMIQYVVDQKTAYQDTVPDLSALPNGNHNFNVVGYAQSSPLIINVNILKTKPLPPVSNLDNLKNGDNIDLAGKTVTLSKPIQVPGTVSIKNGTIVYNGVNGAKTGDDAMACFVVQNGDNLTLNNIDFEIGFQCSAVNLHTGGIVYVNKCINSSGALVWGAGGQSCTITDCYNKNPGDKYWFANFTAILQNLIINNSNTSQEILQGKDESSIRLMQINNATINNLKGKGSNFKQFMQLRPSGKPGSYVNQYVLKNCTITGGCDCGNLKDKTDTNYPFGRIKLIQIVNCNIDAITTTDGGQNGLAHNWGVDKLEVINSMIGGKMSNYSKTTP